jgi:membrane-associated phospholipid phosphatase
MPGSSKSRPLPPVKATELRCWLLALGLCAGVIVLSILFVDRPLAHFMHDHYYGPRKIVYLLRAMTVLVPAGAFAIFIGGFYALAGRALPRWLQTARLAGYSLMWSLLSTTMLLKPAFGRGNIETIFWPPGYYGFHLFQGSMQSAFPSGHATAIASVCAVVGLLHPRLRWLAIATVGVVMVCLVAAGWHFASDVVAGAFVGATAGLMTVRQWRAGVQA